MRICGRIVEIGKEDPKMFRMVMPQFKKIYQNSMMVRESNSKSKNSQNAKIAVAATLRNFLN
jgi:hypothetical protein